MTAPVAVLVGLSLAWACLLTAQAFVLRRALCRQQTRALASERQITNIFQAIAVRLKLIENDLAERRDPPGRP